eukprot:TRINITY_DN103005_c0_g1_i1.p1 TRINITY_DN103005_c0_g1~~TRINITY_DN103005_c0_g1_i1.p1  ORF type:complete len:945 (-),score=169.53 TRINITY_DN103005_c0_g1_i1:107-2941(-)
MLRVGIDVGGTNTDAAVLCKNEVLATAKATTTSDVFSGFAGALKAALQKAHVDPADVQAVMVGTTHLINALVTRRGLARCAVLRLCGGATGDLPPFIDLTSSIASDIAVYSALLPGGMYYNGSPITKVDAQATRGAVREAVAAGAEAIVISGVFSPVSSSQEKEVYSIVSDELLKIGKSEVLITLSADVAGLGILERENASVLNAALRPLTKQLVGATWSAAVQSGCSRAAIYLTQNDGTVLDGRKAVELPIRCVQCGPVNSLRGAAFLAGISDGIVVDIGGTTTDIGAVVAGFPRPSSCDAYIGGVRTNFPVPDVVSIGLGGGSHVHGHEVGPASVGKDLLTLSLAAGGTVCTATDVAVRLCRGPEIFKSAHHVPTKLTEDAAKSAWDTIQRQIAAAVDQCKLSQADADVVLVGGGSFLAEESIPGVARILRPAHADSANAVGAATAQVSGSYDSILHFEGADRVLLIEEAKQQAIKVAATNGASIESIRILDIEEIPLAYLPGSTCRVKVRAVGDLAEPHAAVKDYQSLASLHEISSVGLLPAPEIEAPLEPPLPEKKRQRVDHTSTLQAVTVGAMQRPCWQVSEADVEAISLGVGVLGTGGGGSPYRARLALLRAMRNGKRPIVIAPESLPDDCIVLEAGYMGAPTVGVEFLRSGQARIAAKALAAHSGKSPYAVISGEIGGGNGLEQMLLALEMQIPAVDGDLMGRAFPCLDHMTTAFYGVGVTPAALADHQGNIVVVPQVASAKRLEDLLRPVCTAMGCTAGLSTKPLTGLEVKKFCVKHTVSQAFRIGSAILAARRKHSDPVAAVAEVAAGKVIFLGKVVDVHRITAAGFARGQVTIRGHQDTTLKIDFQNENLVATLDGSVVATTPELICIMETATGRPLQTEEMRYSLQVSVLLLPASPLLRSPEALSVVGPRAFGYDVDFVEHTTYEEPASVAMP